MNKADVLEGNIGEEILIGQSCDSALVGNNLVAAADEGVVVSGEVSNIVTSRVLVLVGQCTLEVELNLVTTLEVVSVVVVECYTETILTIYSLYINSLGVVPNVLSLNSRVLNATHIVVLDTATYNYELLSQSVSPLDTCNGSVLTQPLCSVVLSDVRNILNLILCNVEAEWANHCTLILVAVLVGQVESESTNRSGNNELRVVGAAALGATIGVWPYSDINRSLRLAESLLCGVVNDCAVCYCIVSRSAERRAVHCRCRCRDCDFVLLGNLCEVDYLTTCTVVATCSICVVLLSLEYYTMNSSTVVIRVCRVEVQLDDRTYRAEQQVVARSCVKCLSHSYHWHILALYLALLVLHLNRLHIDISLISCNIVVYSRIWVVSHNLITGSERVNGNINYSLAVLVLYNTLCVECSGAACRSYINTHLVTIFKLDKYVAITEV